jgi:DNA-binding transcriptional LysR family regulator
MDIPWDDMRVFLAVADTKSMSRAARSLRMGQPTVSRRISLLEQSVGHALFLRSVEGVTLTVAGERLLGPARRMAEWAGEAQRAAASHDQKPKGVVRVATYPGIAWEVIAPFAAWMKKKHPLVSLEVLSGISYINLGRGEADLALRLKPADQPDLVTVASLEMENGIFVSREYAKRLGRTYALADLDWIAWAPPYDTLSPNPELAALIPGFAPAFTSDHILVQRRAAEAGLGAIILSHARHRFAAPSTLVKLNLSLGPYAKSTVHLVCPKSALEISRVRVVVDLLASELSAIRKPGLRVTPGGERLAPAPPSRR